MKYCRLLFFVFVSILLFSYTHTPTSPLSKNVDQIEQHTLSLDNFSKSQQLPDILRIADSNVFDEPIEFDPAIVEGLRHNWVPKSLIYEPLVQFDPEKNEIVPTLASQWVVSKDCKHWTFYLRNDVIFHDGSVFNASAVKFSMERVNGTYGVFNNFFGFVEIIHEFQVVIHFSEPYAPFINREAQSIGIISPNSFDGKILINPIGTGPYKINLENSTSTFLHFSRFNLYHAGLPPFKEIHCKIYPLSETPKLFEDILANKFDVVVRGVFPIDPTNTYWEYIPLYKQYPMIIGIFNHTRLELANKNVRAAINYAIDKVDFTSDLLLKDIPLRSILPQGFLGHDASIEGYPYDPERANNLLDEEGYTRDAFNNRFSLTISGESNVISHVDFVSSSLSQIGIGCEIIYEDRKKSWEQHNIDLFISQIKEGLDPTLLYSLLHSEGRLNWGGIVNEKYDLLTTLGRSTPVKQEREYYYRQVQRISQADVPYLLFCQQNTHYLRAKHVAPYVRMIGKGSYKFNCTNISDDSSNRSHNFRAIKLENNDLKSMINIEVTDKALYFPYTDAIVTNLNNQPLTINMKMSHKLTNFLSDQESSGKFYELTTNNPDLTYRFRSYYDLSEIINLPNDRISLFKYDEIDDKWDELETLSSNSSLQYIEVELKGSYSLLRLEESAVQITYKFLPFVAMITILMSGIISFTVFYNQKLAKYVKSMEGKI